MLQFQNCLTAHSLPHNPVNSSRKGFYSSNLHSGRSQFKMPPPRACQGSPFILGTWGASVSPPLNKSTEFRVFMGIIWADAMRKYTAQNPAHWVCCVNHSYPQNPKEWPKLGVGGGGKTRAQILPLACFYIANNLRIFWLLSRVEKNTQRRRIFCDTWKLYKIQISLAKTKVLLAHSSIHLFTQCLWLLSHHRGRVV